MPWVWNYVLPVRSVWYLEFVLWIPLRKKIACSNVEGDKYVIIETVVLSRTIIEIAWMKRD